MRVQDGVLSTEDCILDGNMMGPSSSYPEGAAFYVGGNTFLTVLNTQILNNGDTSSGTAGGALAFKWCPEPCSSAAQVVMTGCTIKGNRATWGGAIWIHGSPSRLSIYGTTLENNLGLEYGSPSSIYVAHGSIVVGKGTHFKRTAAGDGINPAGGTTYYELPGPPGHWLPNAQCKVFREGCGYGGGTCKTHFDACAIMPGDQPTINVPDAHQCNAKTFVQPCDWETSPQLLGKSLYAIPAGILIDEEFPYVCAAGILGSAEASGQGSSLCAGMRRFPQTKQPRPSVLPSPHPKPLLIPRHPLAWRSLHPLSLCRPVPRGQAVPHGEDDHSIRLPHRPLLSRRVFRRAPMLRGLLHRRHQPRRRQRVHELPAGILLYHRLHDPHAVRGRHHLDGWGSRLQRLHCRNVPGREGQDELQDVSARQVLWDRRGGRAPLSRGHLLQLA